jgi:hypothetical protein
MITWIATKEMRMLTMKFINYSLASTLTVIFILAIRLFVRNFNQHVCLLQQSGHLPFGLICPEIVDFLTALRIDIEGYEQCVIDLSFQSSWSSSERSASGWPAARFFDSSLISPFNPMTKPTASEGSKS